MFALGIPLARAPAMSFLARLSASTASLVLLAGCFGSGDDSGCNLADSNNGLARNGSFSYVCTTRSDPQCDGATGALPLAIAQDARFGLRFETGAPVVPVSSKAVRTVGAQFAAPSTGRVGFVVLAEPEAVDAIQLTIVKADAIAIDSSESPSGTGGSWQRMIGLGRRAIPLRSSIELRAIALGSGGVALAGSVPGIEWTVDPPDLVTLLERTGAPMRLRPNHPGTGTLLAKKGALFAEVTIEIVDLGPPLLDAGIDAAPDGGDEPDAGDAGDGGEL